MGDVRRLKGYYYWLVVIGVAGSFPPVDAVICLCGGFVREGAPRQNFDTQVECLPMQNGTYPGGHWAKTCLDAEGRPKASDDKICSMGMCHSGVYCYQSMVRTPEFTYSMFMCVDDELARPYGRPLSCISSKYSKSQHVVDCCKDSNFCNANLNLSLPKIPEVTTTPKPTTDSQPGIIVVSVVPIVSLFLVSCLGTYFVMKVKILRQRGLLIPLFKVPPQEPDILEEPMEVLGETIGKEMAPLMEASSHHSSSITKPLMEENGSGSGSGLPVLTQQRISQQITIIKVIGEGSFGKVLLGNWRSGLVAVKTFPTTRHNSWHRECEIFQTDMLRHENILGFIASDSKDGEYWTEFILVTDYHEHGSLYDYLSANVLSVEKVLAMIISITSGLLHLHMPIVGTKGKPAIAHRDFKTRNILVKRDLTCAIGDLGLCVKHVPESNKIDLPPSTEIGTRRYLAPEILDGTINASSFDDWAMVDIYAFSLVMWEILRRCVVKGEVDEYQPPYYDAVPPDPTSDDMREAVVVKRIRPELSPRWETVEALVATSKLMTECWSHEPQIRLPVLRIKKTLAKALEKHKEEYGVKVNDPAA